MTTPPPPCPVPPRCPILAHYDAHKDPLAAALENGVSLSKVYQVLREHRPNRARKPRRLTSSKPAAIRALDAAGYSIETIALLQGCSRAYVYRCLG